MKLKPLISIIIPLYNRQFLIKETIASVINQTYQYWEALVVDDHSTDNSFTIVQEFCKADDRIQVYLRSREPKGAPACRNIGIDKSRGKYVVFLDADDLLSTTCLENRVRYMEEKSELDFAVFPRTEFRSYPSESFKTWNLNSTESDLDRFLKNDWWLMIGWLTTSPIWKKETLLKLNGFNENLLDWQDWDLHVRALAQNFKYDKVNIQPDWFYRFEGENKISRINHPDILKYKILKRTEMLDNIIQNLVAFNKLTQEREKYILIHYYNFCSLLITNKFYKEAKYVFSKMNSLLQLHASRFYINLILKLTIKLVNSFVRPRVYFKQI